MPTRIHRAARALTKRLGTHGLGLLLIAMLWGLIGVSIFSEPASVYPGLLHLLIPTPIRATMWLLPASLCFVAALDAKGPRRDGLALVAAVVPVMIRLVSYLWAWMVEIIPGVPDGNPRGWVSASVYACMVGFVALVAAIPDERGRSE